MAHIGKSTGVAEHRAVDRVSRSVLTENSYGRFSLSAGHQAGVFVTALTDEGVLRA